MKRQLYLQNRPIFRPYISVAPRFFSYFLEPKQKTSSLFLVISYI